MKTFPSSFIINITLTLAILSGLFPEVSKADLQTVTFVNLERYLGRWYEIARYPAPFQKNCSLAEAHYSLRGDGDIKVVNQCRDQRRQGLIRKAEGRAWIVDKESQAKLKVQFAFDRIRLPFLAGDYWIILLDDQNYSYSVVSEPSKEYLWILSRNPVMDREVFEQLLEEIQAKGFRLDKLIIEESRLH